MIYIDINLKKWTHSIIWTIKSDKSMLSNELFEDPRRVNYLLIVIAY